MLYLYFSWFHLLSISKDLGHNIQNKHKKILKGEEEVDWLGTFEEHIVVSSLGLFFASHIKNFQMKKSEIQACHQAKAKKGINKNF